MSESLSRLSSPTPRGHNGCDKIPAMERQELMDLIKRLPADSVAEVEDFVAALARRRSIVHRKDLHQALADFAREHAGNSADLDPDLEAAASDHLLTQDSPKRDEARSTGLISFLAQGPNSKADVQ